MRLGSTRHYLYLGTLVGWLALLMPYATIAETINIGIVGDQTKATNLDAAYQILEQGVAALTTQTLPLDVVIHIGDLVESTQSEDQIRQRFQQVTGILNQLPAAWYTAAGDHDVNPPQFQQDSPDRSRETLFKQLYSKINPLVSNNLYYSFDVKGYHFIALYTEEHLDTDPRWGIVFYAQISDAQYQWLEQDLAANRNSAGIIVFLHQPHWYNWSGWSRVHALLMQYPVRAVVAGHFHYNQRESIVDGIQYWVVGATGGDTKKGNSDSGDVQHVTVLQIDGETVSFMPIPLPPVASMTWTTRHYMDRVQAIDQVLGNLWNFAGDSPVFLDDGKLVKACGSSDAAELNITDIGNPTEFPVAIGINVTAESSIAVVKGNFAPDMCETGVDIFNCLLKPSAGVVVSNTSVVETQQGLPPLWTGTLGLNGPPPVVGATIRAQITMSFFADNQTYAIYTDVETTVQGCGA